MKVTGILKKISAKSGTGKNGKPWTAYSLGIDVGEKDYQWYRFGFNPPPVSEGTAVSFAAKEVSPNTWAVDGEISIEKNTAPAVARVRVADNTKEDSIVRQNSSRSAALVVKDMVDLGIVSLPKQKAAQYDFYLALLDNVTDHIFLKNRNAKSTEELAKDGVVVDEAVPEEDPEDVWPEV